MSHGREKSYSTGEKGAGLGILVNVFLFLLKLFAGIAGRSQAMVADAFHTAGDGLTSTGVLIGFKLAGQPADEEHPFGHGRAESIVAKLMGVALIMTGLVMAYASAKALMNGRVSGPGIIAVFAAVISILVKELTYRRVMGWAREIGSLSLQADAFHHRSDAFSSVVALLGIAGARMGFLYMDPLAGIVVSGFMIKMGTVVFHKAYDELMDAAPPPELERLVRNAAGGVAGVREIKNFRARKSGIDLYLEVTIGVDGARTVKEGHEITVLVEKEIKRNIANIRDIVVHVEPPGPSYG